jgi:hypothetical protein
MLPTTVSVNGQVPPVGRGTVLSVNPAGDVFAPEKPTPTIRELRQQILEEHLEVVAHTRCALQHAIAAGRLLHELRDREAPGKWSAALTSLARVADVSTRTLNIYMQVAEAADSGQREICSMRQIGEGSPRKALACISKPTSTKTSKTTTPPTPDRERPTSSTRDQQALDELAQLEQAWTHFLCLLDNVDRVVRLRFLKDASASSPWREVAP